MHCWLRLGLRVQCLFRLAGCTVGAKLAAVLLLESLPQPACWVPSQYLHCGHGCTGACAHGALPNMALYPRHPWLPAACALTMDVRRDWPSILMGVMPTGLLGTVDFGALRACSPDISHVKDEPHPLQTQCGFPPCGSPCVHFRLRCTGAGWYGGPWCCAKTCARRASHMFGDVDGCMRCGATPAFDRLFESRTGEWMCTECVLSPPLDDPRPPAPAPTCVGGCGQKMQFVQLLRVRPVVRWAWRCSKDPPCDFERR